MRHRAQARAQGDGQRGPFGWFNRTFDRSLHRYEAGLQSIVRKPKPMLIGYGVIVLVMIGLFAVMPTGFLPDEDQGLAMAQVTLPVGAVQGRTLDVLQAMEHVYLTSEKNNIQDLFTATGFSVSGQRPEHRDGLSQSEAVGPAQGGREQGSGHRPSDHHGPVPEGARRADIHVRAAGGDRVGFRHRFRSAAGNRGGLSHEAFLAARNQFLGMGAQDPALAQVRPSGMEDQPQLHVDVDTAKAAALGVNQADINDTLSSAWGGVFVNDFVDRGRIKRVYMQGDAPFRGKPEDLGAWQVRNNAGSMTPFSAFAKTDWTFGPAQLSRYNGLPAYEIQGQPRPGLSTGAAMDEATKLVAKLPPGVGYEWTGISYQEVARARRRRCSTD